MVPKEFRAEAVRLYRAGVRSFDVASKELGIAPEWSRPWVIRADTGAGQAEGLSSEERDELRVLRLEIRVLREEKEILAAFFAREERGTEVRFRFVAAERAQHKISRLCRLLGVARRGFLRLAGA